MLQTLMLKEKLCTQEEKNTLHYSDNTFPKFITEAMKVFHDMRQLIVKVKVLNE
jgi:hypothetical protein